MATYNEHERQMLREIPIGKILAAFGKDTSHGRDNKYLSPFREECNPSFHVDPHRNVWYDFGSGESGSAVTLVCRLMNCNGGQAYDFLASMSSTLVEEHDRSASCARSSKEQPRGIEVKEVRDHIMDRRLISYAESRGIDYAVLDRWCREVIYSVSSRPDRRYSAIGFGNDRDGWVLRSSVFKGCTSSAITTIDIYGDRPGESISQTGIIFEGFFDFLSWMQIRGTQWPECDICVLNSTVNLRRSIDWTAGHGTVAALFDHDPTGRDALETLVRQCADRNASTSVWDWSDPYRGFGDLNGRFAKSPNDRTQLTIQYQTLWNLQSQRKFRKD